MKESSKSKSFEGKPAKSASTIRSALESLHSASESSESPKKNNAQGPLIDGFQADFPITVTTFYDSEMAKTFQQRLTKEGIFSKLISGTDGWQIIVDAEDSQKAARIYKDTRTEFPNTKPARLSKRFDFMIFGFLMGLTSSIILTANVTLTPLVIAVAVTLCFFGALFGHLADRFMTQRSTHGKIRLGIAEFMILFTFPILIILLWELLPELILKN